MGGEGHAPLWPLEPVLDSQQLCVMCFARDLLLHTPSLLWGLGCPKQVIQQATTIRQWEKDGALWRKNNIGGFADKHLYSNVPDKLQNGYKLLPSAYLMLSGLWCHDKRLVGQFIVVVLVGRDADRLGPRPVLSVDDGLKEPSGIGLV